MLTVGIVHRWLGRSPHGERGLKCQTCTSSRRGNRRRSPHGERGLKYYAQRKLRSGSGESLSSWRAWIEIHSNLAKTADRQVALLMESVD